MEEKWRGTLQLFQLKYRTVTSPARDFDRSLLSGRTCNLFRQLVHTTTISSKDQNKSSGSCVPRMHAFHNFCLIWSLPFLRVERNSHIYVHTCIPKKYIFISSSCYVWLVRNLVLKRFHAGLIRHLLNLNFK